MPDVWRDAVLPCHRMQFRVKGIQTSTETFIS